MIKLLDPSPEALDNPQFITEEIIHLTTELYNLSQEMAQAELKEDKAALDVIDHAQAAGTKISVAESEKRALVETENMYHQLKYNREDIIERINAFKTRIKVLEWEFNQSGQ